MSNSVSYDNLWDDNAEPIVLTKTKEKQKKVIEKINNPKDVKKETQKILKSKNLSKKEKLKLIQEEVIRVLGKFQPNTLVIHNRDELHNYIDRCIENKIVAIDTETNNSLDPITCLIMGGCIYTPGEKNCYIPINHRDADSEIRLEWQINEQELKEELTRLLDNNVYMIWHNGKFDYQVFKCTCNILMKIDWDTMIGAKLLDENEKSAGLKQQYIDKIDKEQEKYDIEHLFEGVEYADVDPDLFALYAATDAYETYKLYEWQMNHFTLAENQSILKLANELEMPLIRVIAEMELNGMDVDQDYAKLLSAKYHNLVDNLDKDIAKELATIQPQIDSWRLTADANYREKKINSKGEESYSKSKNEQLENPIKLSSPTQLAILFYDVLKAPQVNKKSPRGTGEEELKAIGSKLNLKLCSLLLKRREWIKLLTTYIDVIPELAKRWPDGRVRTHFNQYGAKTGRLSSSEPLNFQNVPSGNKEIRMLFKAADGYKIIGSDYSGQEPRLTAFYAQDENMIKAYQDKKDLYSFIASMSFDRSYEDCLEFYPQGTKLILDGKEVICGYKTHKNEQGKERRTQAKSILLGLEYGRGPASIGEQINKTKEEAQEIIDKFFKAFPKVQNFINKTISDAHKCGYVEDVAGRRRRLPDIQLPKYDIKDKNASKVSNFNPFLICQDRLLENDLIKKYEKQLQSVKTRKDYESIQKDALNNNIEIHDNSGFIADSERQAVNSRVQGGAATLTKTALIDIFYDKELNDLGAFLINTVHDEILVEAPEENADKVAERLTQVMVDAAKKYVYNVPMECDPYITPVWYLDEFFEVVKDEFTQLIKKKNMTEIEAFEYLCVNRTESTRDQLYEIVKPLMTVKPDNVNIIKTL